MNTPNEPELLAVIQEDREAAADWNRKGWQEARRIRAGKADNHPLVQTFARHRLDTRPTPAAVVDVEGLRELSERATPGPWAYRPQEYDDWGVIRTAVATEAGWHPVVARAYSALPVSELNLARQNDLDPATANAAFIVAAVNHVRAALAQPQPSTGPIPPNNVVALANKYEGYDPNHKATILVSDLRVAASAVNHLAFKPLFEMLDGLGSKEAQEDALTARDAHWRAWLAREGISYDKGPDGLPKGWGKS